MPQFDFSKLSVPKSAAAQTDPYKIFAALPRLEGAPNDLWRGQSDALQNWHENRDKPDVLISLNTGAGKTLVGLLIAKSFCNEGLEKVIYVCPTNDLVIQTANQARSWGIDVTTRIQGKFDNDLFEIGKAFCITSYSSIFNGLSSLRKNHFPEAIIFDDAHVAESMMRDAFSITISSKGHPQLFSALSLLYQPAFRELSREGEYADALMTNRPQPGSIMVPPEFVASNAAQLRQLFTEYKIGDDPNLKYTYPNIRDHLDVCAVIFRGGSVEITPPFLPSLAVDVFDRRVRRVYLSATLQNKADIIRAFGRSPSIVVEPANDAGNGERLIIAERGLKKDLSFSTSFADSLKADHKVLVAIPGYYKAGAWESVASPPSKDNFTEKLNAFRGAKTGAFILVSRVDGIDLPHDTCRLMIVDGVPKSEGILERYQLEFLHMRTFAASRLANRLVQLFGRINRGRSDYGAFLIAGHDLNVWLANDKHVALLPDLLKNQILLGRHVQTEMKVDDLDSVRGLLKTVLLSRPRDAGWLGFYQQFLEAHDVDEEKNERAKLAEKRNLEAAKAEAAYAKAVWVRDFSAARQALDAIVADTARADEKLAGWHNLWIGAAYFHEGDQEQGRFYYAQARGQIGLNLPVSTGPIEISSPDHQVVNDGIVGRLSVLTALGREAFNKRFATLRRDLSALDGGTSSQVEEAVRYLGEMLGFISTRPDNDHGTGPDVAWRSQKEKKIIGIELKTDKQPDNEYTKHEVAQSMDHLSWLRNNAEGSEVIGTVLVGPDAGYSASSNPTDDIYSFTLQGLSNIREKLLAIIQDAYEQTSANRLPFIDHSAQTLTFDAVAACLMEKRLKSS